MFEIDGFKPVDKTIALEQGTTFHYPSSLGDITIVAKMAGKDNLPFVRAFTVLQTRHAKEEARGVADSAIHNREIVECYLNHVVLRWSTTAKSKGKTIEPTRDNFIGIMTSDAFAYVFLEFIQEVSKPIHFRAADEAAATGN